MGSTSPMTSLGFRNWSDWLISSQRLAWLGSDADIVHDLLLASKPVGKAKRRVVTVYDWHDSVVRRRVSRCEACDCQKRAAVDRADHVICISENTQRDLVRLFGIDPARTSAVHLGYSLARRGRCQCNRWRTQVVAVVRRRPGIQELPDAPAGLREFPDAAGVRTHRLWRGPFPAARAGRDPPFGCRRSGALRIRVRPSVGCAIPLRRRLRLSVALRGFRASPLEAMSHGCPVVCSNAGPIPEVGGRRHVFRPHRRRGSAHGT